MRSLTTLSTLSRSASSVLRSTTCKASLEQSTPFHVSSFIPQCQDFSALRPQAQLRRTTALLESNFFPPKQTPRGVLRYLSTTKPLRDFKKKLDESQNPAVIDDKAADVEGFEKSEKASKAAQVNLSARLRKEGPNINGKAGVGEIIRLIKIARPEAKWLSGMLLFWPWGIQLQRRV